jgi:hypothetical protein
MSPRTSRWLALALGLVLALLAGCSSGSAADRAPGSKVTDDEAKVLAELLHQDREKGGADFVITAPYAEQARITLTGTVDFVRSVGRAQSVTHYGDGRPDETRTLFFDSTDIWFGDVPGLTEAVAQAGRPGVSYLKRPLANGQQTPPLVDVLVQLLLNLQARSGDDPRSITARDYTWQGPTRVENTPAVQFGIGAGRTVAVSSGGLLLQYVTRLPNQGFDVTVTLSGHGPKDITLPGDAETAALSDFPQVATQLGLA